MPKPHFSAYRELPLWVVFQHFTTKTGRPPEATPSVWPAKTEEEAKEIERAFRMSASGRFIAEYGEVEILAGPLPPLGAPRVDYEEEDNRLIGSIERLTEVVSTLNQTIRDGRARDAAN